MTDKLIRVGALKGPHGLQGFVKVALTLEDADLLISAGPCFLSSGQVVVATATKTVGQGLVGVLFKGISTPEAAAALKGALFLNRDNLPIDEDEVLLADLIGQPLFSPEGQAVGIIRAVPELPAGPALEIEIEGQKQRPLIPLEEAFVVLDTSPPRAELTALGMSLLTL